jgi:hypothetical protein
MFVEMSISMDLVNDSTRTSSSSSSYYDCRIHNVEHKHEYLIADETGNSLQTYSLKMLAKNFESIKWNLIRVKGM